MSAAALALALGSALLHAGWNTLLAGSRDSAATTGAALLTAALLLTPLVVLGGEVSSEALPYIGASAALELAYFWLLAAAYDRGELSVVYPVARGSAPVLVLLISAVALAFAPSAAQVAGVALVAVGVLLVRRQPGSEGSRPPAGSAGVLFGLAIGLCIAGYTLIDSEGLDHADALAYFELVTLSTALAFAAALVLRGRGAELRAAIGPRAAATGMLSFAAYALVLGALELAPAAPVAAARESSVVFAALLAALVLREPVGPGRALGAALVAGGVAAVALG